MGLFDRIRDALGSGATGGTPSGTDAPTRESVDRGAGTDRVGVDPDDDRKVGSHGSHWDALTASSEEVRAAIRRAVDDGDRYGGRAVGGGEVVGHEAPADGSLRTTAVSIGGALATAYPVGTGVVHEVTVDEVIEWANGIEAQVDCHLHGKTLGAFDATYYRGREYGAGDGVAVELAAFAYDLDRAEAETVTTGSGEQVSTEGMAGAVPVEGGDLDEYVFQSTPKRVVETAFGDRTVYRLRLPLFRTEDGDDVDVAVYVGDHLAGFRPQEGRDVEGVVWIQGQVRA